MSTKNIMKRVIGVLAIILGSILWLSPVNPVFAQSSSIDSAQGIISVYNNPELQKQKKEIFEQLNYQISIPFELPPGIKIPDTKQEFDHQFLSQGVKTLGDGSITQAQFDFQGLIAESVGAELFTVDAPLGKRLYSVVAGQPLEQCPLEIKDTQIAFFTDKDKAIEKADELAHNDYLVYVSPEKKFSKDVVDNLYAAYSEHSRDRACFGVDGATRQISVDFKDIYELLPPRLQQPAKLRPFVFYPKGDFLYVVNARSSGNEITAYNNN